MRIVSQYLGRETTFDVAKSEILIGRAHDDQVPDIDLSPDGEVSRRHARIRVTNGQVRIEDVNSRWGTEINGREIKGTGFHILNNTDVIRVGKSTLRIECPHVPDKGVIRSVEETGTIIQSRKTFTKAFSFDQSIIAKRRLAIFYELPLELGKITRLDKLFDTIVKSLLAVIAGAHRGSVLVSDSASGQLLLKAHWPLDVGGVTASLTLANRAMESREAFIWSSDLTTTFGNGGTQSAMYAPMIWNDKPLGVIAVDSLESGTTFDDNDLQLIVAVARYAAMAIAHQQLEDELARNASLLGRLLINFSPRVRERLLATARSGRLRLGGEKAEVTILCSDIRGFTRMSAGMDAAEIVELLNDYFAVLVDVLFSFDGTIDKFVGDSILAVFGSPEPDGQQHEKAVRAAVKMQAEVRALNDRRKARGLVTCDVGIGVHCGEVLHGFIGTPERMEFTVIGDAVNFTSRYCDGAKATEIIISPQLHERVWPIVDARPVAISAKHEGDLPAFRVDGTRHVQGLK